MRTDMLLKGLNNPDHVMDTEKMDKKIQCGEDF